MANRTVLTTSEFNAVSHLTRATHADSSFDIAHDYDKDVDFFIDYENDKQVSLRQGFEWLFECIVYPCQHDRLTVYEGREITKLLLEFGVVDNYAWVMWYLFGKE